MIAKRGTTGRGATNLGFGKQSRRKRLFHYLIQDGNFQSRNLLEHPIIRQKARGTVMKGGGQLNGIRGLDPACRSQVGGFSGDFQLEGEKGERESKMISVIGA